MVLIEEAVSSEVKVEPRTKLEESSTSSTAAGGDTSDGFETASEDGHPDNDDKDEEVGTEVKDIEHQSTTEDHPSYHDSLTDEQLHQKSLDEANEAKLEGNSLFRDAKYEEALLKYDHALQLASSDLPSAVELRSISHSNRATCFFKLGKYEDSVKECKKAIDLNPNYVKALLRGAEAHEKLEHYEEAVADMTKVLELDPSNLQAKRSIVRLEPLAREKREKMKEEMIGKLKEMGNSFLGKFGMSIDNFKGVQDPNTGSYSFSFQR